MLNKKVLIKIFSVFLMIVPMATVSVAQIPNDPNGLLADIPEPPGAKTELPSPIPMVYQFMGALMDGNYDVCLSNFDVETFLKLLYGNGLKRLEKEERRELLSYQIQTHRSEFRFLAKVMNRVAGGARIDYSDPRYHGKVQSKVVVRLDTNRGRFEFHVFCCYSRGRWYVYDYILNNQRLTRTFRDNIKGVNASKYLESLRPFYGETRGTRPLRNKEYEFSMLIPSNYQLQENVSPTLLATLSALNGQFLLHVQAAKYDTPQTLAQVGKAIKETLMPFNPRLYDQWKADIAGVEVGNILFHFTQGNRLLYCHMVLVPLGKKLVVFNFYHSTLQIMKHMSNIRENMIRTLSLPRIEAAGGVPDGGFATDINYPTSSTNEFGDASSVSFEDNSFNEDKTFESDNGFSESENNPSTMIDDSELSLDDVSLDDDSIGSANENSIPDSYEGDSDNLDWNSGSDDISNLRPDSFVEDSDLDNEEPADDYDDSSDTSSSSYDDSSNDMQDDYNYDPTEASGGSYGDGNFGDDDYGFDDSDGDEVAF